MHIMLVTHWQHVCVPARMVHACTKLCMYYGTYTHQLCLAHTCPIPSTCVHLAALNRTIYLQTHVNLHSHARVCNIVPGQSCVQLLYLFGFNY